MKKPKEVRDIEKLLMTKRDYYCCKCQKKFADLSVPKDCQVMCPNCENVLEELFKKPNRRKSV